MDSFSSINSNKKEFKDPNDHTTFPLESLSTCPDFLSQRKQLIQEKVLKPGSLLQLATYKSKQAKNLKDVQLAGSFFLKEIEDEKTILRIQNELNEKALLKTTAQDFYQKQVKKRARTLINDSVIFEAKNLEGYQ